MADAPHGGWRDIESAPRDGRKFLAVVDDHVRFVAWTKVSHIGWTTFCLVDQGAEDCDACQPSVWQPLPAPPETENG